MGVQRRVNWISQQRVDAPDLKAIESAASNDFDQLIQAFVTGTSQGYFLRGFEISMTGAIGGAASSLQLLVDPGAVLHINASQSGSFLLVPTGTLPQQLNSATNAIVDGAFTPSAINYVGIDYERYIDSTTAAQIYTWDPSTNSETTKTAPRAQILRYRVKISTSTWPTNVLPIAVVTTDAGNNVQSITDARHMFGRLGQGGATPNPFYSYPWTAQTEGRTESPSTASSPSSANPFRGGDKMIGSMKDWMDSLMTSIKEIKGTTYWYSEGTAGSISSLREDFGNTIVTGKGAVSHGTLPNVYPVLTTTGDTTVDSDQLTNLASVVGIVAGQYIFGTGIPYGTTVLSVGGSTVTMSNNASLTLVGTTVQFFAANVVTGAGQINWDQDVFMNVVGSRLKYKILANPSSADIVLSDDQVAYINLVRNVAITPNLVFTNGSAIVTSVGAISWTTPLQAGDWIRQNADTNALYFQIQSVDSLTQVTLTENYGGSSTGASGAKAVYAFGTYQTSPTPSSNRHIYIASRKLVPSGQDIWWFLSRADNGGAVPRVYVRFIGQELEQGDTSMIDDGVPRQLLQYIGSPMESASQPQYVSALNPNSIPQITSITTGSAASMSSGQYFLIFSSGSDREYYVWVKKDGSGTDPAPLANAIGIEWDVTTGQTASQTAATLVTILNNTFFDDFAASAVGSTVTVTNRSAGVTTNATNFNISAPFAVSTTQSGTGSGNYSFQDGDNLTVAIKKLDQVVTTLATAGKLPGYDETVLIVTSGATPPTSLNGPVISGSNIQLPDNSRTAQPITYEVNSGKLEVFLNGQKLILGVDYAEVGSPGAPSNQIQTLQTLVVGDELEFTFGGGTGGGGGGGQQGPPGPAGPAGPAGADAIGGPVAISTKTGNYTVLNTDNVLLANCAGGAITFTLPLPGSGVGKVWFLKKIDASANAMILTVSGGANIDGLGAQSTVVQYESFTVVSDGTQYWIL